MNFDELKKLCRLSRIKWSKYALERMQERNISRDDVKNCIMHGEIIENYPDDFPYPSCLIYGYTINVRSVIHVVVSCNSENIGIITAYFPDFYEFENDLKTRKR